MSLPQRLGIDCTEEKMMDIVPVLYMSLFAVTVQIDGSLLRSLLALIAGIAIIVKPKLVGYIAGGYLVCVGLIGLLAQFNGIS